MAVLSKIGVLRNFTAADFTAAKIGGGTGTRSVQSQSSEEQSQPAEEPAE